MRDGKRERTGGDGGTGGAGGKNGTGGTGGANGRVPVVAVLVTPLLKGSRSSLRGIVDYARAHGPWRLFVPDGEPGEQLVDFSRIGCDAVVAHQVGRGEARAVAALGVPVVLDEPPPQAIAPGEPLADSPVVRMDSHAVGRMAATYFLARGYRNFAYVGDVDGLYWSVERREGFAAALREAGREAADYGAPALRSRERRFWHVERPRMARFLAALPRPAAVFAANDRRARLVLDACAAAGLRVPEDVAVLGVDDDPLICESCVPDLSSIRTGGYKRGLRVAAILDDLMHGMEVPRGTVVVEEPLAVVTRGSTGYDAMSDPVLSRALAFVRSHAAAGRCTVGDVAAAAGCSRRYLEKRFGERLGASVRRFVLLEKIERAKALLEKGTMPIGDIPAECGLQCGSHLAVLFKKETGLTMRDWRRLHRDAPGERGPAGA